MYSAKWKKKYFDSYRRKLLDYSDKIDFASNDYLGFSKEERIKKILFNYKEEMVFSGSTGSRLISGNKKWMEEIEHTIASYHHVQTSVIFSSGYQANLGLLSSVADRNDLYLIDENVHASIYDGVRLSFAKYFKFKHNDINHLKTLIEKNKKQFEDIYIVIEGLYSMDGDSPDMVSILEMVDNKKVFLIVDETHSFGVMGKDHLGLLNSKEFGSQCAARVIGYGKAFGFSGAAVIGSEVLKKYLINFSRAFIFSTALPLYHYQLILHLYDEMIHRSENERKKLNQNIQCYLDYTKTNPMFSENFSPIQYYSIQDVEFSDLQQYIIDRGIFAKVILPPTVAKNKERVRISLHSFNTEQEIVHLVDTLKIFDK